MKKPLRVGIAGAGSISLGTTAFIKNGLLLLSGPLQVKGQKV